MTLADRLSAAFLGALAAVLIGFSAALYFLASSSLSRSVDDRLEAALATLAVLAEDEPGGLNWERDQRMLTLGLEPGQDHVRWLIRDERGAEVDRSDNLGDPAVLSEAGPRRVDAAGNGWRVARRSLRSSRADSPGPADSGQSGALILSAGLPLGPVERPLRKLAALLPCLSAALWGLTALAGRRLCRTALAPLTRMTATARGLGLDEPGRRLPAIGTGDELDELASAFNGLLDRLHEAIERQARFAGDASHQLRTPLAALIGQVDVALRRDRPAEEYRRALALARAQSDRLREIVEALLFLSRADADAGIISLEVFDLSAWTLRFLDERASGDPAGFDCRAFPSDGPALVRGHPALLAEVLGNLIENARVHGGAGRPPEVRVSTGEGRATIEVVDFGPGIAPGEVPRIFEPFYRSPEARRANPGGVGLGLAVARRIMLSLGGRLDVESRPGSGSRFRLSLPLVDPAEVRPQPSAAQSLSSR